MNKLLIISATLLLSINLFAGKSYNLTVRVKSLASHKALAGCKVSTLIKDVKTEVGQTDANGKIIITSQSEKSIDVIIEDPSGFHRTETLYYYNPKKVDEVKEIGLRLYRTQEEIYFKEVDAKYENSQSVIVNQVPSGKSASSDNDSIDFTPASPLGGVSEFFKFIAMNLEYPQDCIEKNIQGKVYLSFIVQEDGTITHVVIVNGVNPSLDSEACRVIRYAPKWSPATSNGNPVRSLVKTPVNFTLN